MSDQRPNIETDPTVRGALGRMGMTQVGAATLAVTVSKDCALSPEVIWNTWCQIEQWPRWSKPLHQGARWLEGRDWVVGARFEQIRSLGAPIGRQVTVETVREVNPSQSVGWWDGKGGIKSCHMWFFEPLPDGGTRIHKTEVFVGFLIFLFKPLLRKTLTKSFEEAVDGLIRYAERAPSANA